MHENYVWFHSQIPDVFDLPENCNFFPRRRINLVLSVGLFKEENLQQQQIRISWNCPPNS